jgi:hypothetical protein
MQKYQTPLCAVYAADDVATVSIEKDFGITYLITVNKFNNIELTIIYVRVVN